MVESENFALQGPGAPVRCSAPMRDAMVLLVEENPVEATLACAALALQPDVAVLAVSDVPAAIDLLKRQGGQGSVTLAILGRHAIERGAGRLVKELSRQGTDVPVIGIAGEVRAAERARALEAGVSAFYDRPHGWNAYSALMAKVLAEWRVTRTPSDASLEQVWNGV